MAFAWGVKELLTKYENGV